MKGYPFTFTSFNLRSNTFQNTWTLFLLSSMRIILPMCVQLQRIVSLLIVRIEVNRNHSHSIKLIYTNLRFYSCTKLQILRYQYVQTSRHYVCGNILDKQYQCRKRLYSITRILKLMSLGTSLHKKLQCTLT